MSLSKKILVTLISLLIPFGAAASAQAAGETVTGSTTITPTSGSFYKEAKVASDLKIDVKVTPGAGQATVLPMKNVKITFPQGMTFQPNSKICPDSKLNNQSVLSNPATVLNNCRDSVVGTGTASIYLAKMVAGELTDPILIAFNGGKNSSAQPILKIYGFSKQTNVGILMNGVLKGRVLDISIPVLTADSAVANFHLDLPGPGLDRPEIGVVTKGNDPNYVQASCPSSPLVTDTVFELGTRDVATGDPTSPTTTVSAPQSTQDCTGLAGAAKFSGLKIKGPKAVKNGKKGVFKVTVKNTGKATAKNVVVTAGGAGTGKANGGNIAPGASKTIKVKTKVKGKKGKKVTVKFTAKSGKAKATGKIKVKIK